MMNSPDSGKITGMLEALREFALGAIGEPGICQTAIPGLYCARLQDKGISEHRLDQPLASLLIQGAKTTMAGNHKYLLTAGKLLTMGIDMPSASLITEASPEAPLLTLFFYIDRQVLVELIVESQFASERAVPRNGCCVTDADGDFLETLLRLTSLTRKPEQIPVRSAIIFRELHYLLLAGPQRATLQALYGASGNYGQIFAAIALLKANLAGSVRASELAATVNMSASSLYRHFKAITGMSPLQYHKYLRLHEARRLILAENEQAVQASLKVGYESASQFNREYKRLFGESPGKSRQFLPGHGGRAG